MVDQSIEGGQELANGIYVRWRILVTTEIDNDPGDVAEEADRYRLGHKIQ